MPLGRPNDLYFEVETNTLYFCRPSGGWEAVEITDEDADYLSKLSTTLSFFHGPRT